MFTAEDYWRHVTRYRLSLGAKVRDMREGQILSNVFMLDHPEYEQALLNSGADPFYDDSRITAFMEFLAQLAVAEEDGWRQP